MTLRGSRKCSGEKKTYGLDKISYCYRRGDTLVGAKEKRERQHGKKEEEGKARVASKGHHEEREEESRPEETDGAEAGGTIRATMASAVAA